MVREDINGRDSEVGFVDAVGAVNNQFLRRHRLDERCNFLGPGIGYVQVAERRATQLVAGLVHSDGGVLGVGEAGVRVFVSEKVADVIFEIGDDGGVGVELHHLGIAEGKC